MYKLVPVKFGAQLTPDQPLTDREWFKLSVQFRELSLDPLTDWSLLADLRLLDLDPDEFMTLCHELARLATRNRARRILFLFKTREEARRQRRTARMNGNGQQSRFLHADSDNRWSTKAENWLLRGEDPDLLTAEEYEDLLLK